MKQDIKIKRLTRQQLQRIEIKNVDYYIDAHLTALHKAINDGEGKRITGHKEALTELVVKRYYLDPKREVQIGSES